MDDALFHSVRVLLSLAGMRAVYLTPPNAAQIAYAVKVYWLDGGLRDSTLVFSANYMVANQKTAIGKACNVLGPRHRVLMFCLLQLAFTAVTLLLPMLLWNRPVLAGSLIFIVTCIAAWNGATYYVLVFARRYAQERNEEVERLKKLVVHMNDATVVSDYRKHGSLSSDLMVRAYLRMRARRGSNESEGQAAPA